MRLLSHVLFFRPHFRFGRSATGMTSREVCMNWFRNVPVAPKMMATVAIMVAVSFALVGVSLQSLGNIRRANETMQVSALRSEHSSRGTSSLLAYFRAVEFLPVTVSAEQREAYEGAAQAAFGSFSQRLDQLEPLLDQPAERPAWQPCAPSWRATGPSTPRFSISCGAAIATPPPGCPSPPPPWTRTWRRPSPP